MGDAASIFKSAGIALGCFVAFTVTFVSLARFNRSPRKTYWVFFVISGSVSGSLFVISFFSYYPNDGDTSDSSYTTARSLLGGSVGVIFFFPLLFFCIFLRALVIKCWYDQKQSIEGTTMDVVMREAEDEAWLCGGKSPGRLRRARYAAAFAIRHPDEENNPWATGPGPSESPLAVISVPPLSGSPSEWDADIPTYEEAVAESNDAKVAVSPELPPPYEDVERRFSVAHL